MVWELILFAATIGCCLGMILLPLRKRVSAALAMLVYVTAQVVSAVINASVSKMFPLVNGVLLVVCLALAGEALAITSHSESPLPHTRAFLTP